MEKESKKLEKCNRKAMLEYKATQTHFLKRKEKHVPRKRAQYVRRRTGVRGRSAGTKRSPYARDLLPLREGALGQFCKVLIQFCLGCKTQKVNLIILGNRYNSLSHGNQYEGTCKRHRKNVSQKDSVRVTARSHKLGYLIQAGREILKIQNSKHFFKKKCKSIIFKYTAIYCVFK